MSDSRSTQTCPALNQSILASLPESKSGAQIALLITTEFEGIGQNGGVGTYYRELAARLAEADWLVIVVLVGGFLQVPATLQEPGVRCFLDLANIDAILKLTTLHKAMRSGCMPDVNQRNGLDCLFLLQAMEAHYKHCRIFAEFHEMFGFGYPATSAKRAGYLSNRTSIGVTMHSGHEWIFDANRALGKQPNPNFIRIASREEHSFRDADLAMYPSDSLHGIVNGYGWKTDNARRIPYFIPIQTAPLTAARPNLADTRAEIIFFGRLEERKGLFEFIEAVLALHRQSKQEVSVTFLGKSIRLYSVKRGRTTSADYISKHLSQRVPFRILPDLSSKEAIAYVRAASAQAVVCLASPSDNFPNAALEMGQLPVALVVSDTVGFRQTLGLVEREDGVHWFRAGSSESLQQGIKSALSSLGSHAINVASESRLHERNQKLLSSRLELLNDSFASIECPSLSPTYQMVAHEEQQDASSRYAASLKLAQDKDSAFIFTSFLESSIGEESIQNMMGAAQRSDADVVMVGCEKRAGKILVQDALNIADLLSPDFNPPSLLLVRSKTFAELPMPTAKTVKPLHHQLLLTAEATGKRIVVFPYPLSDHQSRKKGQCVIGKQEEEQADLARLLAAIPTNMLSKRTIFHLALTTQQLQSALRKLEPTDSLRQNISNLAAYAAIPARKYLHQGKRLLQAALHN